MGAKRKVTVSYHHEWNWSPLGPLWLAVDMAEFTSYKDTASSRHLRFKLQSLSRRLDELEEATKSLQKAEDELLDLKDKVIQAEGNNSSMLAEIGELCASEC